MSEQIFVIKTDGNITLKASDVEIALQYYLRRHFKAKEISYCTCKKDEGWYIENHHIICRACGKKVGFIREEL